MEGIIVKENYDGVTSRALQAWRELAGFQPIELFIFKNKSDAILQGFYKHKPNPSNLKLSDICEVPLFIARDKYGDEFRTSGCNCGYLGEGPRGTISILEELGIEDAESIVTYNAVIYIDMKNGTPKVEAGKSVFDDYLRDPITRTFESASIYLYEEGIVFTEKRYSRDTISFLKFYLERVIDEVESVSFLVDEEKISNYGRQVPQLHEERVLDFPISVRGRNGVEIWLKSYLFNDRRLEEQSIVNEVLDTLGFPSLNREQTFLDKMKKTFSGSPVESSVLVSLESGELKVQPI
ncbi:hypothetical protein BMEGG_06102 [Priestia megaterium]|uniref:hypothetical protein n=1 Tax=Priestia megaterium TaxID=1404 RepID=UPI002F7EF1C3